MLAHIKTITTGESTKIVLLLPTRAAELMQDIITCSWTLAGHEIRKINMETDEIPSAEDGENSFISYPSTRLRDLRARESITQKQMAEKLGVRQPQISAMEKGILPISLEMANRISKAFNVSYKAFYKND